VVGSDGTTHGAAVVLHDASPEASLEKRCQGLQERATKDPLTQVANRAEFERVHQAFVAAHLERRLPCSLIICDIDFFKQVNDTFGHQAGDEALKSFAQLLKSKCRSGDLVARFGGEEFVVLCADCNNATAARRAEEMRRAISEFPQPSLNGKPFTVSFGVTEVQAGDTPETMLRRADRALLIAKSRGRNTVVQLGTGIAEEENKPKRRFWFQRRATPDVLVEKCLLTNVPLAVTVEKLRGFIADHSAEVASNDGERILLTIDDERVSLVRRRSDRPVSFQVELRLNEEAAEASNGKAGGRVLRTRIYVKVRPKRSRDRRDADISDRARSILASIRSYLMAVEDSAPVEEGLRRRAADVLAPWLHTRDG
jgi:diguanylate cyclase (GGDEF)-like protein